MPECGVFSLPIVVRFDVFKDAGLGLAPGNVPFSVNELDFRGVKEWRFPTRFQRAKRIRGGAVAVKCEMEDSGGATAVPEKLR